MSLPTREQKEAFWEMWARRATTLPSPRELYFIDATINATYTCEGAKYDRSAEVNGIYDLTGVDLMKLELHLVKGIRLEDVNINKPVQETTYQITYRSLNKL